ncbi:glycosyltransferase family 2 protein (plasmid) [Bradyrhizobium sp. ISRA443]|uniref:glycosyltransferase family 2 protein n=1 Tax=unclassified Bradyrhizobium TaxID=2631580 RepID=UPI0024788A1B|nr:MULTISPECIES: glycosyltransferase family 2 protein [unclassified Bradyrhizobium]WGR90802.1 glycosyltransferase family 2 protein [Bradyrhizobium sp. ISRA435]WGS03067.1 glycosyltransferase family 2 protein [Bradyrhizobium sp. ISRA436]WGS09899.1 glycosyltransferase family 2 protein [Bradyrhizobium sp. ISRA437]WGS16784.1 glycosyltransferase family 2 protein [Bradyrhizobium sp. ISRA443]
MLEQITPLIITFDEAPNIARALARLTWARRIVVIDSGSTDGTLELLKQYPQVEVLHHAFENFAVQWNFGLDQITSKWVLSLDADYEISDALTEELTSLAPAEAIAGFAAPFIYRINGKPLRGSLYPRRTVLFRKDRARYKMDGHTQRLALNGEVRPLRGAIYHDDRKPLARWFASQQRYARDEAQHLLRNGSNNLSGLDRLRLIGWPAPILVFLYTLLFKGCLLDGWRGWFYALQRLLAETMLALEVNDHRLRADDPARAGLPTAAALSGRSRSKSSR